MTLKQTEGEILRVYKDWVGLYAPKDIKNDEATAQLLAEDTAANEDGLVSFVGLNKAAKRLGNRILKTPEEMAVESRAKHEEASKKEQAKQARDFLDSIKPQPSFEEQQKTLKVKKDADEAKRQARAEQTLDSEIRTYQCNAGPGRIDWTKTNETIADLKKIEVRRDGKRDAVLTLEKVRQIMRTLP
jgi:hypothetical protein